MTENATDNLTAPPKNFFEVLKKHAEDTQTSIPMIESDIKIVAYHGTEDLWNVQFTIKGIPDHIFELAHDEVYEEDAVRILEKEESSD